MKKFSLATGVAIVGVALSAFIAYIIYLDKCLEDDEANDNCIDSKSDNKDPINDLNNQESTDYEFDTKPYMDILSSPPCEDIENPAPDETSWKSRFMSMLPWLHEDIDD